MPIRRDGPSETSPLEVLEEIPLAPAPEPPAARVREMLLPPAHDEAIVQVLSRRPAPADEDRRLPRLVEPEPWGRRMLFLLVALAIAAGYAFVLGAYWAPAHPGVDQNGYQVGGKNFAQTFSTGMQSPNPYGYIGWMWVKVGQPDAAGRTWYYPKYPLGVPILDALGLWIGGRKYGVALAYMVSPASTVAAVLAMFFFVRRLAGSFAGVLGMLLLGFSPVALVLANNSNSHAPALAFAMLGMWILLAWWQAGSWWRGALAGVLLGYAVLIRYTEGLLLLPLAAVCLLTIRWRDPRSYLRAAVPILAWLVPVLALVIFNKLAMGAWTGYDTTHESTGFTWKNFQEKWPFMVRQLHDLGLFFVLPIGVLGLGLMYRWNWRVALLLTLWFVPGTLLYTSYYWGNEMRGAAYLRFFLSLFPPVMIGAAWVLGSAGRWGREWSEQYSRRGAALRFASPWSEGAIVAPIVAGIVVAIALGMSAYENGGALERDFAIQANLADTGHRIRTIPGLRAQTDPARRPILFGDQRLLLNYLQFAGDFECYSSDVFTTRYHMRMMGGSDRDAPNPLQRERIQYIDSIYEGKTDAQLVAEQNKLMRGALQRRRRVFVALPSSFMPLFRSKFIGSEFKAVTIERWREPVTMTEAGRKSLANLGFAAAFFLGRGTPTNWEIVEVTMKEER